VYRSVPPEGWWYTVGATIEELSIDIVSNLGDADKALDRLSNSLSRMSNTLGGFDTGKLFGISNGISSLSGAMRGIQSVKTTDFTRIANGISKLSAADGSKLSAIGQGMQRMAAGMQNISGVASAASNIATAASGIAKFGGVKVNAAVGNINALAPALTALNSSVANLGQFPDISQFVTTISKLGNKSVGNAISNLPNLANALNQAMQTLSTAPKVSQNVISLTNALANLAAQGGRARTAAAGLSTALNGISTSSRRGVSGVNSFTSSIRNLLGAAGIYLGIRQLMQFGKQCLEFGSSLTEVQNVVDVAFGNMANAANNFAANNAQKFGLSELAAKQYSGVLKAMYNSLGVNNAQGTEMALGLTSRAGDLASFYNIDSKDAFAKIRSAVSGETEPMKQLGVNMNVANLNAYALSNGFGKLYDKMSLAEQAMLRYQYIMSTTNQVSGDFERTSGSFANQLRILQLNFQSFSATMGQGFINVIVHVISALNSLLAHLQTVANAFRAFTALIFGDNSAQAGGGGIADEITGAAGAADNLANNLGGASKAAKELKNATMGIDELNIVSQDDTSGSGSGGAGGVGGAAVDYGTLSEGTSFIDDLNSKLSEMLDLLEPTTNALKKLWDEGLSKLKDFTFGTLQDFYDKFLKPVGLWTLSEEGLPRFINITNDMLNRINWTRLQDSLRRFYEQLARLTKLVFTSLLDFYEEFLVPIAAWTLGDALPRLIDVITNLSENINWEGLVSSLKNLYEALSYFAIGIGEGLVSFVEGLARVLTPAISGAVDLLSKALNGIADAIKLIPEGTLAAVGGAIGGLATAILAFNGISAAITAIENAGKAFSGLLAAAAANPVLALAGALGALAGAFIAMEQNWSNQVAEQFLQFQQSIGSNTSDVQAAADSLYELADSSSRIVASAEADAKQLDTLKEAYFRLADQTYLTAQDQIELKEYAQQLIDKCPELKSMIDQTTGRYSAQREELEKVIKKHEDYMMAMAYSQVVSEYSTALANANVELEISSQKCERNRKALEDLRENHEKMIDSNRLEADLMVEYQDLLDEYNITVDESGRVTAAVAEQIVFYENELRQSEEAQRNCKVAVEEATAAQKVAQDQLKQYEGAYQEFFDTTQNADWGKMVTDATKAIDDLGGVFVNGKQVVGPEAVALYQEIIDTFGTLDKDMHELGNRGMVQFGAGGKAGVAEAVPTMTEELWSQIEAAYASDGYTVAYDGGRLIVTGTTDGMVEESAVSTPEATNAIIENVEQGLSGMGEIGSNAGKAAIEGVNQSINDNAQTTQEPVKKWADLTREYYTNKQYGGVNAETFGKAATDSASGFNKEIKARTKDSQEPMETWAKSSRDWFTGQDENQGINAVSWTKFAENIIKAFDNKILESYIETQGPMETWAKNIREWFWGDSNPEGTGGMYDAFYNMARRINEGFAQGISDFAYMAKDAIRKWAREAMEEAEEEFDINSPSKRFWQMGAYDIQGFNNAFADLGGTTQAAIDKWAGGLSVPALGLDLANDYGKYVPNYGQDFINSYGSMKGVIEGRARVSMESSDSALISTLLPYLEKLDKLDSLENLESMPEQKELLQQIADKDTEVTMNGRRMNEEMVRTNRRKGFSFTPT
jgi:methyl-accepting chemotaxis protein